MNLPPAPDAAALEALRASVSYQAVRESLEGTPLHPDDLEGVLEQTAALGNAPAVLALLDAGAIPGEAALVAALDSPEPLALHTARLLFEAGARPLRLQ